jgi:hypothetical protein
MASTTIKDFVRLALDKYDAEGPFTITEVCKLMTNNTLARERFRHYVQGGHFRKTEETKHLLHGALYEPTDRARIMCGRSPQDEKHKFHVPVPDLQTVYFNMTLPDGFYDRPYPNAFIYKRWE